MKLLDLFCGAGGCSVGYVNSGFTVVGVDIKDQPNYPYEFIKSDVFEVEIDFNEFDVIHASPPCQAYTRSTSSYRKAGKTYPDLLGKTKTLLVEVDKPYIIENVVGAPLVQPLMLCGTMFNLRVLRHRLFEIGTDTWIYPPCGCRHVLGAGEYVSVINSMPANRRRKDDAGRVMSLREQKLDRARRSREYRRGLAKKYNTTQAEGRLIDWYDAMDIDWMTKATTDKNMYDMTQAIPPAYTEWIGSFLNET